MLSLKVVIVFLACLAWSYCDDSKYCSLCKEHTMCKYKSIGPDCKKSGDHGVTGKEKQEIVDTHNVLRRQVALGKEKRGSSGGQPKAADLRKFVWDDELAKVAQRWANQCRFGHDTCRKVPRGNVGQNVYWEWGQPKPSANWTKAILSWYSEIDKFNPQTIQQYRFDFDTGHYTQMLWHSTYAIGCGRKSYGDEQLYVCNYGPAGNWIGQKMYTIGEPCSKCPRGTVCKNFLCDAIKPSSKNQTKFEPAVRMVEIIPVWKYNEVFPRSDFWYENLKGQSIENRSEEVVEVKNSEEEIKKNVNEIFPGTDILVTLLLKNFRIIKDTEQENIYEEKAQENFFQENIEGVQENFYQENKEEVQENFFQENKEGAQENFYQENKEEAQESIYQENKENVQENIYQENKENVQENIYQENKENVQENIYQENKEKVQEKKEEAQENKEEAQQNVYQENKEKVQEKKEEAQENIYQENKGEVQQNVYQENKEEVQENIYQEAKEKAPEKKEEAQ